MRISIIGLPASGKSALARKISEKFSIPHIQIDRFWFEAGGLAVEEGRATPEESERVRESVREKVLAAIKSESWVSDGFYHRHQTEISARADIIVYLNISLWQRLLAHAKRIFQPGRHRELSWWHELKFFGEIIVRTIRRGPVIKRFAEERKEKVAELRSWKAANEWLNSLNA